MFSMLTMLSQDKVNIFNDRLIELMEYILNISDSNINEANAEIA